MSLCSCCPALRRSRLTIRRLAGGTWPADIADWRQVYRRAGVRLRFLQATDPTFLHDGTAYIAIHADRRVIMRRLCHEIVEHLTTSDEYGPEMRVCPGLTRHDVARATECVGEPSATCVLARRTSETPAP